MDKLVLVAFEARRPGPLIVSSHSVINVTLWWHLEEVTTEECAQVLARPGETANGV